MRERAAFLGFARNTQPNQRAALGGLACLRSNAAPVVDVTLNASVFVERGTESPDAARRGDHPFLVELQQAVGEHPRLIFVQSGIGNRESIGAGFAGGERAGGKRGWVEKIRVAGRGQGRETHNCSNSKFCQPVR